ncbi:MAG: hypothetical protein ACOC5R_03025 [Elusimicrobiota bacterium]
MQKRKALFLIDGVHKPDNTIFSIKELCKKHNLSVHWLVWIGGTEKIEDRESFSGIFNQKLGIDVIYPENIDDDEIAPKILGEMISKIKGVQTVVQLSGAPQIYREKTENIASAVVSCGASYIAGGTEFKEYQVKTKHAKPSLGIYATDKRVGKTAFGSYIGNLACGIKGIDTKWKPIIITHSRGGPPDPPLIDIYKKESSKSVEDLTVKELLSSRIKPEYLGKLVDFGLHGASDVFEDALILSAYLDQWEQNHKSAPYISMVGCRRAGAGYFNEFTVSNADKGIIKANKSEANLIIHEGSGAEHPPVDVDGIIFLIPSDVDIKLLKNFPGIEKAVLFIIANYQKETIGEDKERIDRIKSVIGKRITDIPIILTQFVPEAIVDPDKLKGKKVGFFTTAPDYILNKLSKNLQDTYGCEVVGCFNNLDSDKEMKASIDYLGQQKKPDLLLFEIKARGVEGAKYGKKEHQIEYYYVNNIPRVVDKEFRVLKNNSVLDKSIIKAVENIDTRFNSKNN